MSYMGLDVGTTGSKAVVFGERGEELARAYREYPTLTPREGWAELDSRVVSDSCLAVIGEAAEACAADPVVGLAVSSQGEAFTPLGPGGEILAGAMVSFDTRSAALAETWSARFGRERLYKITGHTAHPMFTLFKLLWLRDNRPEVWSRAERFLCFEDLVHRKLELEPAISWPLAGRTMLFNILDHDWDDEILSEVGLERSKLARPLPSGSIVGTVPGSLARELHLAEDVIVAAGGHDQTCAALGSGVTSPGKAMYATGTVECICPAFPEPRFSDELFRSNLCTYDYTIRGMYATVAFSLTGGNLLKWFRDEWGRQESAEAARTGADAYDLLLEKMSPEPTKLMVLPYFTPTGTPYFDARATGAILGLRLTTTRAEVLRALLEGVAFEMRLNLDILGRSGIHVGELLATGGGAKSRVWTQLKADVLNTPITPALHAESGCFGAAVVARSARTATPAREILKQVGGAGEPVEPDPGRAAFYEERFETYRKLYPALRQLDIS